MDELIPMVRDNPAHPGGPVTADVHPHEVINWLADGWIVADTGRQEIPHPAKHKQRRNTDGD